MAYRSGCHTTFHHRYHLVWAPKCRYKVEGSKNWVLRAFWSDHFRQDVIWS